MFTIERNVTYEMWTCVRIHQVVRLFEKWRNRKHNVVFSTCGDVDHCCHCFYSCFMFILDTMKLIVLNRILKARLNSVATSFLFNWSHANTITMSYVFTYSLLSSSNLSCLMLSCRHTCCCHRGSSSMGSLCCRLLIEYLLLLFVLKLSWV
jgi:hypothetical protein